MKRLLVVATIALAVGVAPAAADAPVISGWPGNLTVEATSPAGATVNYAAPTATVGTKSVDVVCTPPRGAVFPLGSTGVNCKATNPDTKETSEVSFTVTVVDTAAPAFSGISSTNIEATGPNGVPGGYTAPTAHDLVDGDRPVTCTPPPTVALPFGPTVVTCTARDTRGNVANNTVTLTVRDTTPPKFRTFPDDVHVKTDGPDPVDVTFGEPTATDVVDGFVAVQCDPASGDSFPLGETTVDCTAEDTRGNQSDTAFTVLVEDLTAPGPVRSFGARMDGKAARLTWRLPTGDVKGVEITRLPGRDGKASSLVYKGTGQTFTDRTIATGAQYRYRAISYDAAGNRSKPVAASVAAKTSALLAPPDGQRISSPPDLRWIPVAAASYYNVQLFYKGRKILSIWPKRPTLRLPSAWTFERAHHKLVPGLYVWYVWPGFGQLSAARYGALLGSSSFVVVRGPDAPTG